MPGNINKTDQLDSTSLTALLSSYIDVAPNEYVTKYSFNRNFEKLLSNDFYLYSKYGAGRREEDISEVSTLARAQTYNAHKTYDEGEYVFYKISKSDTKFYILRSNAIANTHKPTVRKSLLTGDLHVVNSDYWTILGITSEKGNSRAKDEADAYLVEKKSSFQQSHEMNTEVLSAHPPGQLSMQKSSKAFLTLENIEEDRKSFFYPSYLQSFVADSTVYSGYMRKWDNGLLEYDVIFRLGYISSDSDGVDVLCANNVAVSRRNNSFMYFKSGEDYNIFNRGGDGYAVTNTSRQLNLNTQMNAYAGKIRFIEPFKDLNYMVFTSNYKQVELEAYNIKNNAIEDYDSRLVLDGLAVAGTSPSAIFKTACSIPDEVVNIQAEALAGIEQVDNYPVEFNFSPWTSKLVNIDVNAFTQTGIVSICIPASTRHIAKNAFIGCGELTSVSFYLNSLTDVSSHAQIGENAFALCPKLSTLFINYKAPSFGAESAGKEMLGISSLVERLDNPNYRAFIGLPAADSAISIVLSCTGQPYSSNRVMFGNASMLQASNTIDIEEQALDQSDDASQTKVDDGQQSTTIDVNDLIVELSAMEQQKAMQNTRASLFAATKPALDINSILQIRDNVITGFDDSMVIGDICLDLNDLIGTRNSAVSAIQDGALDDFGNLTGLICGNTIKNININNYNLRYLAWTLNNYTSASIFGNEQLSVYLVLANDYNSNANAPQISIMGCGSFEFNGNRQPYSNFISSQCSLDAFYFKKFVSYSTGAFTGLSACDSNIILDSLSLPTSLCSNLFGIISDDDDEYFAPTIQLVGCNWTIAPSAFNSNKQTYISIDLHGSTLCANALYGANITMLQLSNILSNNINNQLIAGCFTGSGLFYLNLGNVSFSDLSNSIFDAHTMSNYGLASNTIIADNIISKYLINNNNTWSYSDRPSCFKYNGNEITGFISSDASWDSSTSAIIIPHGTTSIADNVFKNLSACSYCFLPNTLIAIGASAFAGMGYLDNIDIEPGIQLTSIGVDAFANCPKLYYFAFT